MRTHSDNAEILTMQSGRLNVDRPGWVLGLAALSVLMGPFYVWRSGLPQLTDLLTVVTLVVFVLSQGLRLSFDARNALFVGMASSFAVWVASVNIFWTWSSGMWNISLASMFYAYNVAVAILYVALHRRYGHLVARGLAWCLGVTVVTQVLLIPFGRAWGGGRMQVFFNNPNQLAYYAILTAAIIYAVSYRTQLPTWAEVLFYGCCSVLVAVSISRAATAAMAIILVGVVFRRPSGALFIVILGMVGLIALGMDGEIFEQGSQRFERIENASDRDRGYQRIFDHPHLLVLGAGEGSAHRLASIVDTKELHSSFGTVLFAYGIPGVTILLLMYALAVRSGGLRPSFSLLAPFVFGLTHQGLRFPLFWLHLAVLITLWQGRDTDRVASESDTS